MAVEEWANQNDMRVLAVARDGDWEQYCANSERIDHTEDFSAAISSFNRATAPFALVQRLETAIKDGKANGLLERIGAGLDGKLDDIILDQDAESSFYWEPDGASGWFKSFEVIDHEPNLIEIDEEEIVVGISVNITVGAEGNFSLSAWDGVDKEHVALTSVSVEAEDTFETEILVPLTGDFEGDINDLEVGDIEVVNTISSIHFGELQPDWW